MTGIQFKNCYRVYVSKQQNQTIYKTVVSSVLCVCETWSFNLREEHIAHVLEYKMLRKISGRDDNGEKRNFVVFWVIGV